MRKSQSKEDYLEAILLASREQEYVHQVDIARKLNVSLPAAQKAIRLLTAEGLIEMQGLHMHLTEQGRQYAEAVYEKHCVLYKFLTSLGVDCKTANDDACEMEHVISESTYLAIRNFLEGKK